MIAPMPAAAADWVYDRVLTRRYKESTNAIDWVGARENRRDEGKGAAFLRVCSCQYGPCGHCSAGRHDRCSHRERQPAPACTTYLQNSAGLAIAEVWRSGKPCAWLCTCDCRTAAPVDPEQPTVMAPELVFEQISLFELAGGAR